VLLAIKTLVDRERISGRFLLTGSANVLLLPKISESLAGRMEVLTLWPFSQGEIESHREAFVDAGFASRMPATPSDECVTQRDLAQRVLLGGYPEVLQRKTRSRRSAWFEAYVTTVIHRELRDLANLEYLTELPRLLRLLASRVGAQLNYAELAGAVGIPQTTLKRYQSLLEATFLIQLLPPWATNLGKRVVRSPKVQLCDTGLASSLLGIDEARLKTDSILAGQLLEAFVVMELRKQASWSAIQPRLHHYRSHARHEVDVVLEEPGGKVVGVEVKAAMSIGERDLRGLKELAEIAGDRLVRGIILYQGDQVVPFARNVHAVPISCLWSGVTP
jgi:predicted AAA+ superfamily ATPase